jgi:choline dehydrogenase-like flavoprotein
MRREIIASELYTLGMQSPHASPLFSLQAPPAAGRTTDTYDAIVVGSGATGGWAAKKLSESGMRVAVLEAGAKVTPKDYTEHVMPWQLPYLGMSPKVMRDRPVQGKCYACTEYNYKWFVNDYENPYVQDKPFSWIRMRVLGGRSLSWGRQSYRMGPLDLKAASHDGYGEDWPVTYEELVPYYEEVEKYVGISGIAENLPQLPDSIFMPPMDFTCAEIKMRDALKAKMGRVLTMGRAAILTRNHNGRAACHYCGPCERGCTTNSYFNSPGTTLKDALATGRTTILTDAVAARVLMKDGGTANGIEYIDSRTRELKQVRAKVVLLCASTLESTRLMMNSNIANSSGALGKYLMDHIYQGGASGVMDDIAVQPWVGMPRRPNGIYIPRFRNIKEKTTNGFIRGYGYQGSAMPAFNMGAPGFGAEYKNAVGKGAYNANIALWGECLPRKENYVALDSKRVDAWGIPILRINMEWSDNEKAIWRDGVQQGAEMLEAAGAKNIRTTPDGQWSVPGHCIHEVGTARMGADEKKSVLNKWCQSWDVKNLFVTDGAAWVSIGCGNPTLTMMALTVRTCDYITREFSKQMA